DVHMIGRSQSMLVLSCMLTLIPAAACSQEHSPALPSEPVPVKVPDTKQESRRDAKFTDELLSILNETKSPDAFLVTLSILQEVKPDAQEVVPAIIRNAERLRLFKRTDPDQPTEQQKMIVECIAALMKNVAAPEMGGLVPSAVDAGAFSGGA